MGVLELFCVFFVYFSAILKTIYKCLVDHVKGKPETVQNHVVRFLYVFSAELFQTLNRRQNYGGTERVLCTFDKRKWKIT